MSHHFPINKTALRRLTAPEWWATRVQRSFGGTVLTAFTGI